MITIVLTYVITKTVSGEISGKVTRIIFIIKTSNTRIAADGINHVQFFCFVFGHQLVGNNCHHVIFCKEAEGRNALLRARDMHRVKNDKTDERGNIASSNEIWPVLHEIVLRHCRTVPITADIVASKLHAIGTEEALPE